MYTINSINSWTGSTDLNNLKILKSNSTIDSVVSDVYVHRRKPLHKRIAATLTALSLALTLAACGDKPDVQDDAGQYDAQADVYSPEAGSEGGVKLDSGSDAGDGGVNHPPGAIDDGSVTPPNNSSYNVGDSIPTGFDAPSDPDGDSLEGKVVVSAPSQSFTKEFPLGTLTPGTHYGVDIDSATANAGGPLPATAAGTAYTIELVVSDGNGGESKRTRSVTLTAENPAKVTGCNVINSVKDSALRINCTGQSSAGSITNWYLTGGPSGAIITGSGTIGTGRILNASDVGLHTYDVSCSDGTNTSPHYIFTVPVDEHYSTLVLHCQGGSDESLLLPETSVDTVATTCGTGFNPALKPNAGSDPDYILDVTPSCVQGAINGLTAAEKEAHTHYNQGRTVADVYSSCTVDFAQVKYIK